MPTPEARGPAATVASLTEVDLSRTYVIAPFTSPADPAFAALEALVRDSRLRGERALTSSGREIVAVTHADAGKGPALRRLCEALGVERSETAAFGDTEVDLPMIELAGFGVAMGDAPPEVQAAADLVTGTAGEDGVATAIGRIWGKAEARLPAPGADYPSARHSPLLPPRFSSRRTPSMRIPRSTALHMS